MEYRYLVRARREIDRLLKKDKPARRMYDGLLKVFESTSYEKMRSLEQVKPIKKSPSKLHEWICDLPNNRTGRMMFVISTGVAFFLYFFIKKSHKGNVTPPEHLQTAEGRAKQFRLQEQRET